jgi:toxin ParE1/3/4
VDEKPYREVYAEAALEEILEIAVYLENQQKGLEEGFRKELENAVDFILAFPEGSPVIHPKGARRFLLKRFSYSIVYILRDDLMIIVAVAHTKRSPNYWVDRLD